MANRLERYMGVIILALAGFLILIGVFTVLKTISLEKRIAYLEQCCDDVQGRLESGNISEEAIRKVVSEEISRSETATAEQMKSFMEEYVREEVTGMIGQAKEEISGSVTEQLEQAKTTKKSSSSGTRKSSATSSASTSAQISTQTTSQSNVWESRSDRVQTIDDPEDAHFKVGEPDD